MSPPTVATTRLATTARRTGGGGLRACRQRTSTSERGRGVGAAAVGAAVVGAVSIGEAGDGSSVTGPPPWDRRGP